MCRTLWIFTEAVLFNLFFLFVCLVQPPGKADPSPQYAWGRIPSAALFYWSIYLSFSKNLIFCLFFQFLFPVQGVRRAQCAGDGWYSFAIQLTVSIEWLVSASVDLMDKLALLPKMVIEYKTWGSLSLNCGSSEGLGSCEATFWPLKHYLYILPLSVCVQQSQSK